MEHNTEFVATSLTRQIYFSFAAVKTKGIHESVASKLHPVFDGAEEKLFLQGRVHCTAAKSVIAAANAKLCNDEIVTAAILASWQSAYDELYVFHVVPNLCSVRSPFNPTATAHC